MSSLVSELVAGIEKGDDEAIMGACETVDAFYRSGFKPYPPYDERLATEPPNAEDIEQLKRALLGYVDSTSSPNTRAFVALGKCRDHALVPLLRERLATQLKAVLHYNGDLSSLIVALDNMGEKLISSGSHSPMEMEKNVADARAYLKQFGQVFPW